MNKTPTRQGRLVGLALVATGLGMVAYALSDDPLYGGEPGFGLTQTAIVVAGMLVSACAFTPFAAAQRTLLLAVTTIFTTRIICFLNFNAILATLFLVESRTYGVRW